MRIIQRENNTGAQIDKGKVCNLDNNGKMVLAKADAESTADNLLGIAMNDIAAGAIAATGGAITITAPSGTGNIVRILGYALSAYELYFNPDNYYTIVS